MGDVDPVAVRLGDVDPVAGAAGRAGPEMDDDGMGSGPWAEGQRGIRGPSDTDEDGIRPSEYEDAESEEASDWTRSGVDGKYDSDGDLNSEPEFGGP